MITPTFRLRILAGLGLVLLAPALAAQLSPAGSISLAPRVTLIAGGGSTTPSTTGISPTSASITQARSVAVDASGNIYITDTGATAAVEEISAATGKLSVIAGGCGCSQAPTIAPQTATGVSLIAPAGVAVDASGNVYIAESGLNEILEVTGGQISIIAGGGSTTPSTAAIAPTAASLNNPSGVAVDQSGSVFVADTGNSFIEKINAARTHLSVVAGGGLAAPSAAPTAATTVQLNQPSGIWVDAAGNGYIADSLNNLIEKVDASTANLSVVAGGGSIVPSTTTAAAAQSKLNNPTSVVVDAAGNIYIGDSANLTFDEVFASNATLSVIAGGGSTAPTTTPITAPSAQYLGAYGVALLPDGSSLILSDSSGPIDELTTAAGFPSTAVGATSASQTLFVQLLSATPISSASFAISPAANGAQEFTLGAISGCATDGFTLNSSGTICQIAVTFSPAFPGTRTAELALAGPAPGAAGLHGLGQSPAVAASPGSIQILAGGGVTTPGAPSPLTSVKLSPTSLAVGNAGSLYVGDANKLVEQIAVPGGLISLLAGGGSSAPSTTAVAANTVQLTGVNAVAADAAGNVYVADASQVEEVYAASGSLAVIAGGGPTPPSTTPEGATSAQLSSVTGLAVDTAGNLYITDWGHNQIDELFASSGQLKVIAGGGAVAPSTTAQSATSVQLSGPAGLALDAGGNLYIVDQGHNEVEKLTAASGQLTVVAGGGSNAAGATPQSATGVLLASPVSVALDAAGNVYIGGNTGVVDEVYATTAQLAVIAGGGSTAPSATAESAVTAQLASAAGVAGDAAGNVFIADSSDGVVQEVTSTAFALSFSQTNVGNTSASQTVTISNFGNQSLAIAVPGSGNNPSLSTNFDLATGGTACPIIASGGSAGTLASGAFCTLGLSFAPTTTGNISGSAVLTDNVLNAAGSTQRVALSGNGGVTKTTPTITWNTLSAITYGTASTTLSVTVTYSGATAPTMSDISFTVGSGAAVAATGCTTTGSPETCTASYTTSGLNASSTGYTATASFSGDTNFNAATNASSTLVVNKATAAITVTPYNVTYDGNAHTAVGTATGVGGINLASDLNLTGTTHTHAGTYTNDTYNFTDPSGNYNNVPSATIGGNDVIAKANATVSVSPYSVAYNGLSHTAIATATGVGGANLASGLDLSGTTHTNAGTYSNDTYSFTDSSGNYNNVAGAAIGGNDVIAKAAAAISVTPYSVTYDGNPHTATATATGVGGVSLPGSDFTLTGTTHTNANTYTGDTYSFTDPSGNYSSVTSASVSGSDVINKATATITVTPYNVTYDGNPHTATATATGVGGANLASDLNLGGTTHTNAGTYAGDAWTFADPSGNYNGLSGTVTDTITKAPPPVTIAPAIYQLAQMTDPQGVAMDAAGNVYISVGNEGEIQEINAANGAVTTIAGGGATSPTTTPTNATELKIGVVTGLALDRAGNLYLADSGANEVYELFAGGANAGKMAVIAGGGGGTVGAAPLTATAVGLSQPQSLALDGAGDLFIAEAGASQLDEVPAGSGKIKVIAAGLTGLSGIAADAAGDVYLVGDNGVAVVVQKIPAGQTSAASIAGTGTATPSTSPQPPLSVELNAPQDIAVDAAGNVFISTSTQIDEIFAASGQLAVVAGGGSSSPTPAGVLATGASIAPQQIYAAPDGRLLISSSAGVGEIYVYSTVGALPAAAVGATSASQNIFLQFNLASPATAITAATGPGGKPEFILGTPSGCTLDGKTVIAAGTICTVPVTFRPAYPGLRTAAVSVVNGGATQATVGLYGTGEAPQATLGPGSISLLDMGDNFSGVPNLMASDAAGNLYLADDGNNTIEKFTATGGAVPVAGSAGNGPPSISPQLATSVSLNGPQGVAVDAAGNIYLTDAGDDGSGTVDKIFASTGTIAVIAGAGAKQLGATPQDPNAVQLSTPRGIAVDAVGNIYFVVANDLGDDVAEIYAASGQLQRIASQNTPILGLAVDAAGNLYGAEGGAIVRFGPPGATPRTVAQLSDPYGLAAAPGGNLYASDAVAARVYEINPASGQTTVVAGGGPKPFTDGPQSATSGSFSGLAGVALDPAGNLYVADANSIRQITAAAAPLAFPSTAVGAPSTDQTVTLSNLGNQPLQITPPASGSANPAASAGFSVDSSAATTCPIATASATAVLPAGSTCTLALAFAPTQIAATTGTLTVTDNNLNAANATQSVNLSGAATIGTPTITSWPLPVSSIIYGTSLPAADLDATASVAGTYSYYDDLGNSGMTPTSTTLPVYPVGPRLLGVFFQPTDKTDYQSLTTNGPTLQITQATLTITAPSATISLGATPNLTPTYSGFVNSESVSSLTTPATCATTQPITGGGAYTIHCSGAVDPNYFFKYTDGTLTVNSPAGSVVIVPQITGAVVTGLGPLAEDAAGNVYTVDPAGNLKQVLPGGQTTVINSGFGSGTFTALATDGAGSFYFVRDGNLWEFSQNTFTLLDSGAGGGLALSGAGGVAVDAGGNAYYSSGTTGSEPNLIWELASNGHFTIIAGGGTATLGASAASATSIALNHPTSVAADAAGDVFILERGSNSLDVVLAGSGRIVRLSPSATPAGALTADAAGDLFYADTNQLIHEINGASRADTVVAGGGAGTAGATVAAATSVALVAPNYLAAGPNGTLVITDGAGSNAMLDRYASGAQLPAASPGLIETGGTVLLQLNQASSISAITASTADDGVNEFILLTPSGCDTGGTKVNPAGTICAVPVIFSPQYPGLRSASLTVTGGGQTVGVVGIYGTGQGPELAVSPGSITIVASGSGATPLINPTAVAVDASGNVYVVNRRANQILKVGAGGSTVVTSGIDPTAVAVDAAGNVYFSAYPLSGNSLAAAYVGVTYAATGQTVTLAGGGSNPPSSTPASSTSVSFGLLGGLAVDATGNVFIADIGSGTVDEILAGSGQIEVIASIEGLNSIALDAAGNLDMALANGTVEQRNVETGALTTLTSTRLNNPSGLAVDAAGDIYEGFQDFDSGDHLVAEIPAGAPSTLGLIAGGGSGTASTTAASAINVALGGVAGLAVDGAGDVFFADSSNAQVDKIAATSLPLSFPATALNATSTQMLGLSNIGNQVLQISALLSSVDSKGQPTLGPTGQAFADFEAGGSGTAQCIYQPNFPSVFLAVTVPIGAGCAVNVTFTPTISGQITGMLELAFAGSGGQQVSLLGLGASPTVIAPITTPAVTYGTGFPALTPSASVGSTAVTGTYSYSIPTGALSAGQVLGSATYTVTVQFTPDAPASVAPATTTFQFIVKPAPLTVTATNLSRVYNTANPTLTYAIAGLVNGDPQSVITGTPTLSTAATQTSDVVTGGYPITVNVSKMSAGANYTLTPVNGALTITPASQTVTFTDGATPGAKSLSVSPNQIFQLQATASSGLPVSFSLVDGSGGSLSGSEVTVTTTAVLVNAQAQSDDYLLASAGQTLQPTGSETLAYNPSQLAFGDVLQGGSALKQIVLSPPAIGGPQIASMSASAGFKIGAGSGCKLNAALTSTCAIDVTFSPDFTTSPSALVYNGALTLVDTNGTTYSIPLTGRGLPFAFATSGTDANTVTPTVTVDAGGSASLTFTVSIAQPSANGITISLACAGAPGGCVFNPYVLTFSGTTTSYTVTVTFETSGVQGQTLPLGGNPSWPRGPWLWLDLLALLMLPASFAFRHRRRRTGALLGWLAGAALLAGACGGISNLPNAGGRTPAGTYPVAIQASSGAVTTSTTVNLVVN